MSDRSVSGWRRLSGRERSRLAGILGRLSSPFDSERAAAGLLATAFLAKHHLTWSDLVEMAGAVPDVPAESAVAERTGDRRLGGRRLWRGYCRRRPAGRGASVDLTA